jgi:hypothetical protein
MRRRPEVRRAQKSISLEGLWGDLEFAPNSAKRDAIHAVAGPPM